MDLMNLKAPPDRVVLIADAIERDLKLNQALPEAKELREVLTWLRWRIQRWNNTHPTTPAA